MGLEELCRVFLNYDGDWRELLQFRSFVGYSYQKRSSLLRLFSVVDRKVKNQLLIQRKLQLSHRKEPVGQNGKSEEAENKCAYLLIVQCSNQLNQDERQNTSIPQRRLV